MKFHEKTLPLQAQYAPVFTITLLDHDADRNQNLLLFSYVNQARLRFGKSDANYGMLLKGDGKGGFAIYRSMKAFSDCGEMCAALCL